MNRDWVYNQIVAFYPCIINRDWVYNQTARLSHSIHDIISWIAWDSLVENPMTVPLHDGGSDLRLYVDPGIKLESVGWCMIHVFGWANRGAT